MHVSPLLLLCSLLALALCLTSRGDSTRDGSACIQLNRTLDDATLIEGTMLSDGTFTGTITDPAPDTQSGRGRSQCSEQ